MTALGMQEKTIDRVRNSGVKIGESFC